MDPQTQNSFRGGTGKGGGGGRREPWSLGRE